MKHLLSTICALVLFISCTGGYASDEPTVVGAWELDRVEWTQGDSSGVWQTYKSVYLFTEKHYSIEDVSVERPSFSELAEGETRSYEEIAKALNPLYSNSGTYEIRGDTIYYSVIVTKNPGFMNDRPNWQRQLTVGKDTLTSTQTGENSSSTSYYVRLN